jgi:hypothetical protein
VTFPLHGIYIGIVSVADVYRQPFPVGRFKGKPAFGHVNRVHCAIQWSRDLLHWEPVANFTDFIPLNWTQWNSHLCYASASPVIMANGSVRIYYGASDGPHDGVNGTTHLGERNGRPAQLTKTPRAQLTETPHFSDRSRHAAILRPLRWLPAGRHHRPRQHGRGWGRAPERGVPGLAAAGRRRLQPCYRSRSSRVEADSSGYDTTADGACGVSATVVPHPTDTNARLLN